MTSDQRNIILACCFSFLGGILTGTGAHDMKDKAQPTCQEAVLLSGMAAPSASVLPCAQGAFLDVWDGVPVCLCPREGKQPSSVPRPPQQPAHL